MNDTPIDCVLDVDTGVDDAHALLLALRHPRLNVLAVTTVAGNLDVETCTAATLKVLDAADAPLDLPVAMGCARPLVEPTHYCPEIHGQDALGDLQPPLPTSTRTLVKEHAVTFLITLLRDRLNAGKPPLTLIALAPLTNIGLLVRMAPDLVKTGICKIVWMGKAPRQQNAPRHTAVSGVFFMPWCMFGPDMFWVLGVHH
jgi:pyrimidine-specific ribonucleoside hydrolase